MIFGLHRIGCFMPGLISCRYPYLRNSSNLFQLTFATPHISKELKRAQSAVILACDNLKFIAKLPNCVAITYSSTYPSNVDSLSNRDYKNII